MPEVAHNPLYQHARHGEGCTDKQCQQQARQSVLHQYIIMLASGLPVGQQRAPRHGITPIWSDNSAQPARARVMKITSAIFILASSQARQSKGCQSAPALRLRADLRGRPARVRVHLPATSAWPQQHAHWQYVALIEACPEARQMWHQQTDKRHRTCHADARTNQKQH